MSDGTVPVKRDTDATSGTPGETLQDAINAYEATFNTGINYFMWDVWTVVDEKAFKYSSHLDRNEAYRVAESFNGVVTETPLVADFRERDVEACQPVITEARIMNQPHRCDFCGKPATHCYREGQGTGHSEHICACEEHREENF